MIVKIDELLYNKIIITWRLYMNTNTSMFDDEANPLMSPANLTIIIVNIIVFILTDFLNLSFGGEYLIDTGTLSWDRVFNYHEYYRIITSTFLHADIDHIFNNMLVLLFLGTYIEQYMGKIKYLIIYFSSGIIAGFTSMVYNMLRCNYTESIGASGAIFGMMGALLYILLTRYRKYHDLDLRRVAFMVFLSLYGGFKSQGVDNAAHVGGFICGIITAVVLNLIHFRERQE